MWKMTGWLAKTVAAGLIISFLSIWTTGYIVNSYVETLLKQFNIPLDEKPFALSSVWGGLWGADPLLKSDQDTAERNGSGAKGNDDGGAAAGTAIKDEREATRKKGEAATEKDKHEETETEKNEGTGAGESEGVGTGTNESEGMKTETETEGSETPLAVDAYSDEPSGALTDIGGGIGPKGNSGAASKNGGDSGASSGLEGTGADSSTNEGTEAGEALREGVAITTDELNETKSGMSQADKELLFNVMMKKLPQEAWQRISGLMEGGLTNEELTEVQQLIAQHLDRDEYDRMMEIMKKY